MRGAVQAPPGAWLPGPGLGVSDGRHYPPGYDICLSHTEPPLAGLGSHPEVSAQKGGLPEVILRSAQSYPLPWLWYFQPALFV